MRLWIAFVAAAVGYFLGAISFTRLVAGDVAPGDDLGRTTFPIAGSDKEFELKTVSASSVAVRKGPGAGCLTSVLDMLKVTLPMLAFRWLFPNANYDLVVAAAGVAGHNYPVYYGFKGGRGMSPLFGGLILIDWLAIPVTTLAGMVIGLVVLRDIFISYLAGPLLLFPWFWWRGGDWRHLLYAAVVNVLFWSATWPEVREYYALKRAGEFDKGTLLEGLEHGHTGSLIRFLRKRGWIKEAPRQVDEEPIPDTDE